ncbi:hypothetical protein ACWEJ6_52930 [Nonomuraea sp. NPDC004702]
MNALLSELGKKIAERWLSLLVLPGALFLAVALAARTLGHAHALNLGWLTAEIGMWARSPVVGTVGGQVIVLGAILAAAAAAGLVAQACGSALEYVVLAAGWRTWPWPLRLPAGQLVARRARRWSAKNAVHQRVREQDADALAHGRRADPAPRHRARRAVERISAEPPDRPTWSGDRTHAVALRLERDLQLDLATVWPHLWLHLPDTVRAEIGEARVALARATTLGGWALLYLPLTIWWWPALPTAAVLAMVSKHRVRSATDAYATLVEACVRLHVAGLADHLGIDHAGRPTTDLGATVTRFLTSSRPPATPPP